MDSELLIVKLYHNRTVERVDPTRMSIDKLLRHLPIKKFMVQSKPFLKWAGGKTRVVDELVNLIESKPLNCDWTVGEGERYYEPFLGSGAMFFGLKCKGIINTKKKSMLSDVNDILVNCMNVVLNDIKLDKLILELYSLQKTYAKQKRNPRRQTKEQREKRMYYIKRRRLNKLAQNIPRLTLEEEIELASLMIFLNKTCFNGLWRMNKNGEHNVPEGDYNSPTNICQESTLRNCNVLLKSASISTQTYTKALMNIKPGDLVYLDPPYMPLEIDGNTFSNYFTDGFSKQDQIDLANLSAEIASKGSRVIASNHDALGEPTIREIYENAAKIYGCRVSIQPIKVCRNISCKGHGRIKVNEVLIFMAK